MEKKKNYKFTNKKQSEKGIMSFVLGIIAIISLFIAVYQTFLQKGMAGANLGLVGLLAACFAVVGLILGFLAKMEVDRFLFFAYVGIVVNILALGCVSVILYAGASL